MFPTADVLDFLMNEFAGLGCGRFAFTLGLLCLLDSSFFRHI